MLAENSHGSAVWAKGVCYREGVEKGIRTVMWLLLSS